MIRPLLYLVTLLAAPFSGAVTVFQLDTFGSPASRTSGTRDSARPVIGPDAGPEGFGDSSLRITGRAGGGAGGHPAARHRDEWTGDDLGAGVHTLSMDLRNLSRLDMSARAAVNNPGGWFLNPGHEVPVFGSWEGYRFDLTTGELIGAGGTDPAAARGSLSDARILPGSGPAFPGAVGQRAVLLRELRGVPEPSTTLLTLGLTTLLLRRSRSARTGTAA